ncbi:MAG: hypothetical protein NW703_04710 [Nitrospiraceae bacterium]
MYLFQYAAVSVKARPDDHPTNGKPEKRKDGKAGEREGAMS